MTFTPPTNEPQSLVVGDRWQWDRSLSDYPSDVWTLKYSMHRLGSVAAKITITATQKSGTTDFEVDEAKGTTAAYTAGDYEWFAFVTDGTTRRQVDSGTLEILVDLEADAAVDRRTHARKMLDAIEAALEGNADSDVANYAINGRSITRIPRSELLAHRNAYRAEVNQAERKDRARNGLGHTGRMKVRF